MTAPWPRTSMPGAQTTGTAPLEADGWRNWVALAITHLLARSDHHDHTSTEVLGHLMEIQQRLAVQEASKSKRHDEPSVQEWLTAVREIATGLAWVGSLLLGALHLLAKVSGHAS